MKGVAPRRSTELTPIFPLNVFGGFILVPFLYIISGPLSLDAELLILKYYIRDCLPASPYQEESSYLFSVGTTVSIPFLAVSEM